MDYFIDIFKKYKDFSGRASRKEFWTFFLLAGIITVVVSSFFAYSLEISSILNIFFILLVWSVAVRRLHDTNHRGAWALVLLIPNIILGVFNFFLSIFNINPYVLLGYVPDSISMIIGWVIYPIVAPIFFIFALITIVYLFRKGQSGENKYGLDPLIKIKKF